MLRVPPRRTRPPAPAFGLLPLLPPGREELEGPPVAFGDVLGWARGHLYSGVAPLHAALVSLNQLCAHVGDQLLWCMAPLSEAFKVGMGKERGGREGNREGKEGRGGGGGGCKWEGARREWSGGWGCKYQPKLNPWGREVGRARRPCAWSDKVTVCGWTAMRGVAARGGGYGSTPRLPKGGHVSRSPSL